MPRADVSSSQLRSDKIGPRIVASDPRQRWLQVFQTVRGETERRAASLSEEDQQIQSMADASPIKWHRAHTTWFFEQFILVPHAEQYETFDERFPFLFNSYYVAAGPRHARPERGLITRPSVADVAAYRAHVDAAVARLIESAPDDKAAEVFALLEIGLHHEQQHQELMFTDLLHAFAQNPFAPAYLPDWQSPRPQGADAGYVKLPAGLRTIGHGDDGFCFDNERPVHQTYLQPARMRHGLVTNGEWLDFMLDDGYVTPSLWLSDGWVTVGNENWSAPGYWRQIDGTWFTLTLGGLRAVDPAMPVCHISYYEADAFARWAGKHLPTEFEWEVAARSGIISDAFGLVWQWTRSAYLPYPGYRADPGALGEYNGKFMINQMVLRGSSLATPQGHARASYRNFFPPPARWQFSGLRLVEYLT
ncbi:MAG: ergothioneine biosynthesis protein EgtB [Rhizobiales bacterium]|nr:ergothioneine biosynthesis protein EgtB [Hyphomicrobiales bacterium]